MRVALLMFDPERIMWGTIHDGMCAVISDGHVPYFGEVRCSGTKEPVLMIAPCGTPSNEWQAIYNLSGGADGLVLNKLVIRELPD